MTPFRSFAVPLLLVGMILAAPRASRADELSADDNFGRLTIGGRRFTPAVPACGGWVAGERVRFVAFDGPGACRTALIYNYHLRQTCEVACPWGFAGW